MGKNYILELIKNSIEKQGNPSELVEIFDLLEEMDYFFEEIGKEFEPIGQNFSNSETCGKAFAEMYATLEKNMPKIEELLAKAEALVIKLRENVDEKVINRNTVYGQTYFSMLSILGSKIMSFGSLKSNFDMLNFELGIEKGSDGTKKMTLEDSSVVSK